MTTPIPAELELQLRQLQPTCDATRIRDIPGLFRTHRVEEPCTEAATHVMHVVCDGPHPAYPTQLACGEHAAALEAMQAREQGRWGCRCGGTIVPQLAPL